MVHRGLRISAIRADEMICKIIPLSVCIRLGQSTWTRSIFPSTMRKLQITQKLRAAPSAKHHSAGMSTSSVLTVCHPNQVFRAPSLTSSISLSDLVLDLPASVIRRIGPATIGTKARCPKANTAPYAYHLLTAVVSKVACDRSQRLAINPDAVDRSATPAMRLPAGARNTVQNRERARPEIFSEASDGADRPVLFLSWRRRKAKNKGYCSNDMPTVADDVHSGKIRPKWPLRGLSGGIDVRLEPKLGTKPWRLSIL